MNWQVFYIVLAFASVLATIGCFASMATAFEFDGMRAGLRWTIPVLILALIDALLIGLVVPS